MSVNVNVYIQSKELLADITPVTWPRELRGNSSNFLESQLFPVAEQQQEQDRQEPPHLGGDDEERRGQGSPSPQHRGVTSEMSNPTVRVKQFDVSMFGPNIISPNQK